MIKVLVFDFDGIILESVDIKDQAIYDLFEDASAVQRERILDLHRKTPGIGRRNRITMLWTKGLNRSVTPDTIEFYLERFSHLIWKGLMSCPEVPGVRKFLESIKSLPCYVVSAAPQDEVKKIARERNFHHYFIDILGTPPGKDRLLQQVSKRQNVSASSILFFGDKLSDFKASEIVGTQFIGRILLNNNAPFSHDVCTFTDFKDININSINRYKKFDI